MDLNNDIAVIRAREAGKRRPLRLGALRQLHPGSSRSPIRHHDRLHGNSLLQTRPRRRSALFTHALPGLRRPKANPALAPRDKPSLRAEMSVPDLGVRAVVAAFFFLMPIAGTVLVFDRPALPWRALLGRRSGRGGVGRLAGGEGLGKDVARLIGPSAVMLDDRINDMAHRAFPLVAGGGPPRRSMWRRRRLSATGRLALQPGRPLQAPASFDKLARRRPRLRRPRPKP